MWREIRKTFLAGLIILIPITLTIYIFYSMFRFFDGLLNQVASEILSKHLGVSTTGTIPGLGILAILLLLLITGAIARNYIGKKVITLGETIVHKIPLINRIYRMMHEISEAVFSEKRELFKEAVLIEYPKKDLFSIAFFTQDTKGSVEKALKKDVISVFLPTTPNPTSGYLLFIPKSKVIPLDMSVEDALKLVISGGTVPVSEKLAISGFSMKSASKKK